MFLFAAQTVIICVDILIRRIKSRFFSGCNTNSARIDCICSVCGRVQLEKKSERKTNILLCIFKESLDKSDTKICSDRANAHSNTHICRWTHLVLAASPFASLCPFVSLEFFSHRPNIWILNFNLASQALYALKWCIIHLKTNQSLDDSNLHGF